MMRRTVLLLFATLTLGTMLAAQAPVREITRIAGEVYRFRNNFHFSVFAVTPEGIIATDPISADAAQWLKAQLQERFGVVLPVNLCRRQNTR